MYRDPDIIVKDGLKVAAKAMTDTSVRYIEGNMCGTCIVMIGQRQAFTRMSMGSDNLLQGQTRTSLVHDYIHPRMIKAPAFCVLCKLLPPTRLAQYVSSLEHDYIRLFRVFWVCRIRDLRMQLV